MIDIIPAGPRDAQALAEIHAQAFDDPWSAGDIAALAASPGAFALAARLGAAPAGFILCRVAADEAEVLTLATAPPLRRRGVAGALLDAGLAGALIGGAASMFLEVAADNGGALALYRGRGFVPVGTRPAYYRRPQGAVEAVLMRRDLNR